MATEKINLDEIIALTKELFHEYYAGEPERWFSYLCPDSIYLGTGEPLLFGGDAIRAHFKEFQGNVVEIMQEEYYPVSLHDTAAQVCGVITVKSGSQLFGAVTHFTMSWRLMGGELKIIHQHNSYEYIQPEAQRSVLKMDLHTIQFVRGLLLDRPRGKRLAIPSGRQTVFVNPHMVLYVQSQRKRTELVCIDREISCNLSIGELSKVLPEVFYPLHRSYLVNTLYIVALRRFEVELISGITLPIPAQTYTQVKEDLQHFIQG